MPDTNPFKGKPAPPASPMRTLHRFAKPGGHWAEIRERKVTQWQALEFLVIVDGSMLESQMFHGARINEYPAAIEERIKQFTDGDWTREPRPQEGLN